MVLRIKGNSNIINMTDTMSLESRAFAIFCNAINNKIAEENIELQEHISRLLQFGIGVFHYKHTVEWERVVAEDCF